MLATAEALVEYFNNTFEFYGRKIELVGYEGRGLILSEFTGGGQDAATNDSIKVANEIGAFADLTGLTQPYADALARNKVVNVGAPYMSREWFEDHRPYAWSTVPDCTATAEMSAIYSTNRLFGREARWAQDDMSGEERTLAVVAPNNLEYQQCVDAYEAQVNEAGHEISLRLDYILDPAQLQTQAATIMAKLQSEGTTSVSCACDPIMQMYLAQQARRQDYYPEWLVAGVGFIDLDLVGQIISKNAPDQWRTPSGAAPRRRPSRPRPASRYDAYKRCGTTSPSMLVDQHLLPAPDAGARHPDGRARAHARDLRDRAVRLPGRHRPGRHLGLQPRSLHASHRHPRDLVGPGRRSRRSTASPGRTSTTGSATSTRTSPKATRRCSREAAPRDARRRRDGRRRCWPPS